MEPPTGLVPKPLNGAVSETMSLPRMLRIRKACERRSPTEKSWSRVRFRVPASMKLASVTGLDRVSLDRPLSSSARMNACWRRSRERSPSLSWCRSVTNATAFLPSSVFQPLTMPVLGSSA